MIAHFRHRRIFFGFAGLVLILTLSGCGTPSGEETSGDGGEDQATSPEEVNPALLLPALAREEAPEEFSARFETTAGSFVVKCRRADAPVGADRFYNLVKIGFFDDAAFFRAIKNFIIQFGVHADPDINELWSEMTLRDESAKLSNERGTISFAQSGPRTRTTQLFINLQDNAVLDESGFVPVARVVEGMESVDSIYTGYGEMYPKGQGPRHQLLNLQGNAYLELHFPELDYINEVSLLE